MAARWAMRVTVAGDKATQFTDPHWHPRRAARPQPASVYYVSRSARQALKTLLPADVHRCSRSPCQTVTVNEGMNLVIVRDESWWQSAKRFKDEISLPKAAQRQLPNNERMGKNLPLAEWSAKGGIIVTKIIDPDGSIDQDHAGSGRRRGAASLWGSVPPRRARRTALSRSIRALRASRTSDDFSVKPVKDWAFAISSSSNARVVRINRLLLMHAI